MRKWIVMLVLVLAVAAMNQTTLAQSQAAPQQPAAGAATGQPAAPQQKKEIKDPNEYNAYMAAINQNDPNAKAVALEGYLQQYPNSVVKGDALQLLMATYQQLGNMQKLVDTATRLIQVDPKNIRALALMSYLKRAEAEQAGDKSPNFQQAVAQAKQYADQGLEAVRTGVKPEGVSDADFEKLKKDTTPIFNGVSGWAALQTGDFATAQQRLQAAVDANPNNLADVYPLANAYLRAPQPNFVSGVWYMARASALAHQMAQQNPAAAQALQAQGQQIARYGRSFYIKYHGNDQGWDQVLQAAAANAAPPAGFTITPRPTPAEEAAELVKSKPVKDMSFDEFQVIFTSGNQQAADQVWNEVKGKPIAFEAKVVQATANQLVLAATFDDGEKNPPVGDVTVTMVAPIPARLLPKVGEPAKVEGTPVSYTTTPFMITMEKGSLIGAKPPAAAPAKRPPARKPPAKSPLR